MLTQYFGMLIPGFANAACGPMLIYGEYLRFYYYTWSTIQVKFEKRKQLKYFF